MSALEKLDRLRDVLRTLGSCVVAYSGGVDSVFLAYVAREVLGDRMLAVMADSPSLARSELEEGMEIARRFSIPLKLIQTREFENAEYLANAPNRCFFCKSELFAELGPVLREHRFAAVIYGENASDTGDDRPGRKAAEDFQVRAPLKEVGLTKVEIRELSARLGLPTADKPQMACLSSRVPHGEAVTVEKLGMIEQAEAFLRGLGFYDVRVRHHELSGSIPGISGRGSGSARIRALARIEVGPGEMGKLFQNDLFLKISEELRGLGYTHVTVDLQAYRRAESASPARSPAIA